MDKGAVAPLVDLLIEDTRWEAVGIAALAERAARAALAGAGRDPVGCEISVLACDDARIAVLNAEFRGKAEATNVLSWPAGDVGLGPVFFGDIALAWETCAREAAAAGIGVEAHLSHLVVHGVLHLLGFGHEAEAEAEAMEALERKILATLGVADPYAVEERPRGA